MLISYILLGLSAVVTFGIIVYLFAKLTPAVIPQNLVGFFTGILWTALWIAILFYVASFLIMFFAPELMDLITG